MMKPYKLEQHRAQHKCDLDKRAFSLSVFGCVAVILAAAAARLLPHPPNVTPIMAMGLFAGANIVSGDHRASSALSRLSHAILPYLLPLTAMLVSDIAIQAVTGYGFHRSMPAVYLAIAASVLLGQTRLGRRAASPSFSARSTVGSIARIGACSVGASVVFFLLSNASVWAFSGIYSHTVVGLGQCFLAALPFFRNALIGDLVWAAGLFGAYVLAKHISIMMTRTRHRALDRQSSKQAA